MVSTAPEPTGYTVNAMQNTSGPRDLGSLLTALGTYRTARKQFLAALGCDGSNRDPFAEFAEHVALSIVGGQMAQSRVQKGWDFTDRRGLRVQVRYLANPAGPWVNEHLVDFRGDVCDRYALVLFEALDLVGMVVFDRGDLAEVCRALKKRHPRQDETLQFTCANFRFIATEPGRFAALGVEFSDLSTSALRRDPLETITPTVTEQTSARVGEVDREAQ
jgi:hypothetical protein